MRGSQTSLHKIEQSLLMKIALVTINIECDRVNQEPIMQIFLQI